MTVDPLIPVVARFAYAALFGTAVFHKLRAPQPLRESISRYLGNGGAHPGKLANMLAVLVMLCELVVVMANLVPCPPAVAAGTTGGLLAVYGLAMAVNLVQGNRIADCGCSFGAQVQEVNWALVARNAVLVVGAAVIAVPAHDRPLGFLDVWTIGAAVAGLGLVYVVANTLLLNTELLREQMR